MHEDDEDFQQGTANILDPARFRRFMELREKRDADKLAAEKSEKEYRRAEQDLWDDLEESPIKGSLKVDLGYPYGVVTFGPQLRHYGRIIDIDAAMEYLEQRALVDEFTTPKISAARVNELVRTSLEAKQAPPDGFDFYSKRYVSITRQK
jgi:hypothetical protein